MVAFGRVNGRFRTIRGPCSVRVSTAVDINEKRHIAGSFLDEEQGIRWAFVASNIEKGN